MVSPKSVLATGLLLLSSFSYAAPGAEATGVNTNTGPIIKAVIGPSGEIQVSHAAQKRDTYGYGGYKPPPPPPAYNPKDLLNLLKEKKQAAFCKSYINLFPVVTKHATVTNCGRKNPNCLPTTITKFIGVTKTITNTVTAATPTGMYPQ